MLISDRDGVLFDTCEANLASYTRAANSIGLKTNDWELERAIHSGEGIFTFSKKVWVGASNTQLELIKESKQRLFVEYLSTIRLNFDFVEDFLVKAIDPYLVTRASYSSTKILLDYFDIHFFGDRVIGGSQIFSKIEIYGQISAKYDIPRLSVTVVDDCREIIEQSIKMGFMAIQYPHFCAL
jgi:phosphoglycolate phosphatase-like HAD superfamily hydrolase